MLIWFTFIYNDVSFICNNSKIFSCIINCVFAIRTWYVHLNRNTFGSQRLRLCQYSSGLTSLFRRWQRKIFFIAAWMLVEGLTLFRKTVSGGIQGRHSKQVKLLTYALGWCLPAVIVILSAGIGFGSGTYMQKNPLHYNGISPVSSATKYSRCWISSEHGVLQGAVMAPILAVLAANGFITVRVGHFVYVMSSRAEAFKPSHQRTNSVSTVANIDMTHVKASLKAIMLMMPVMGLPWIFGVLAGTKR